MRSKTILGLGWPEGSLVPAHPSAAGHTWFPAVTICPRLVAITPVLCNQKTLHRHRTPGPCCSFRGESLPLPCGAGGPPQAPSAVAGHRLRLGQWAAQGHPSGQQEVPPHAGEAL